MERRHILVLANSIKKGGRCIAGRELLRRQTGWRLGPWVRPVSDAEGGTLHPPHMALDSGGEPSVLDRWTATTTRSLLRYSR